ncbi:hypothetical protein [Streptomyces uncialis]|uniref:hypothetical protein n=1 Tax=Streptomyces uncialis TaxID=1048205 RepID=UPI0037A20EE9
MLTMKAGGFVKRDVVLFTNSKHARGAEPEELARKVLGAWLAGRGDGLKSTNFDPARVAVVVGTAFGKVIGVYDTVTDDSGGRHWSYVEDTLVAGRQRVRFHGQPSEEFAHLVGQPSPVTWARGERNPVKTLALKRLRELYAEVETVPTGEAPALRARVGDAVLTVEADGSVIVDVPPGTPVTVRSATPQPATASHHTPSSLARAVVENVLAPSEEALLKGGELTNCDPAVGTGGFLTASYARIAELSGENHSSFLAEVKLALGRMRAQSQADARQIFEQLRSEETVRELAEVLDRRIAGAGR